jgi:peptidylprolyl isomerase
MKRDNLIAWGLFLLGVGLVVLYGIRTLFPAEPEVAELPRIEGQPQIELTIAGEANGTVLINLLPELAPYHVERVLTLTREGAYDGVVFHRVLDGFMAQTGDVAFGRADGDLARAGMGGSSYPDLPAEFSDVAFVAGTVGMARSSDPDSANSQFFITFAPAEFLNGKYTVIGHVAEGFDVVYAIKRGEGENGAIIGAADVMTRVRVLE